jgi:hypothetical protein
LSFQGVAEYLEDLVARIDAPRLDDLMINFFHQLTFDTPQLTQFISRTPNFTTHDRAHVVFSDKGAWVTLPVTHPQTFDGMLLLGISCSQSDWQLSSLTQVCSSFFPQPLIYGVEDLSIRVDTFSRPRWQDDIDSNQWLELLHPFTAVRELHISSEFTQSIAPALQELVGERVTEVLPVLQSLFLDEPPSAVKDAIEQFVAARQLDGHPIAIPRWGRKNESFEADEEKDDSSYETDEEMDKSSYETDGDSS